jgi:DNA-binding winged helix-turn-helix (wHTH) protein
VILEYPEEKDFPSHVHEVYYEKEEANKVGQLLAENKGTLKDLLTSLRSRNGERIEVRLSATTLYNAQGQRQGTVGYFEDMRSFQALENRVQLFTRISFMIAQAENLNEGLSNLAEFAVSFLSHTFCRILRLDERGTLFVVKAAAPVVGNDPRPYHLGMLFQAANRFLEYNPALSLTANELARFAHLLLAAAMLYGKISQGQEKKRQGIQIDKKNKTVLLDGSPLRLPKQSYDLLYVLYEHADKPCARREIFERAFKQSYDESNESHGGRLDTAIRRLREKIEIDPSRPRYLLTDPRGYRFVPKPKD